LFWVVFLKQSLNRLRTASTNVSKSYGVSAKGFGGMPLTQKVSFKTVLQRGNRVQVSKLIRWQFKMGTKQVLKVAVNGCQRVERRIKLLRKKGQRRTHNLPKLNANCCRGRKQNLTRYVMEVTLEPT